VKGNWQEQRKRLEQFSCWHCSAHKFQNSDEQPVFSLAAKEKSNHHHHDDEFSFTYDPPPSQSLLVSILPHDTMYAVPCM
jgi:hypothetical protein